MCNYSLSHRPRDLQLKWNGRNIILRLSRILVYYTRNAFALFHSRGLNNVYQTSNNFHHRDRQSERSKWRYFSILFLINWQVFSFARLSQLSISLYIGYIRRAISFLPFFQRMSSTYFLLNVLITDQLGLSKPVSLTSVIYYRGKPRSVNTAETILLGKQ